MTRSKRTYRTESGKRIEGTWRSVFIHNAGTYFLTELKIYEDGLVDCWGLVDLSEFRRKVAAGWVTTHLPPGASVSAPMLASWTAAKPTSDLSDDELIVEVVDEIERLAGRPTAADRCIASLDKFLDAPDETARDALRAAYLEIPPHLRRFVLGDMDAQDRPLRVLMTRQGQTMDGDVVTASHHEQAMAYFAERWRGSGLAEARTRRIDSSSRRPSTLVPEVFHPTSWPKKPGEVALRAEYPRPLRYQGRTYPSVYHAFWAAAIEDVDRESDLMSAPTPHAVEKAARSAGIRADWPDRQIAVMSGLLRLRFQREKDLATILRSTGRSQILYEAWDDRWWGYRDGGENWMGRLLELVRSELCTTELTGPGRLPGA